MLADKGRDFGRSGNHVYLAAVWAQGGCHIDGEFHFVESVRQVAGGNRPDYRTAILARKIEELSAKDRAQAAGTVRIAEREMRKRGADGNLIAGAVTGGAVAGRPK